MINEVLGAVSNMMDAFGTVAKIFCENSEKLEIPKKTEAIQKKKVRQKAVTIP